MNVYKVKNIKTFLKFKCHFDFETWFHLLIYLLKIVIIV